MKRCSLAVSARRRLSERLRIPRKALELIRFCAVPRPAWTLEVRHARGAVHIAVRCQKPNASMVCAANHWRQRAVADRIRVSHGLVWRNGGVPAYSGTRSGLPYARFILRTLSLRGAKAKGTKEITNPPARCDSSVASRPQNDMRVREQLRCVRMTVGRQETT